MSNSSVRDRTVSIPISDKKAIRVDVSKWSQAELRQCLEEVKRSSFSPGQRAIDTIVEEYNRRHPVEQESRSEAPMTTPTVDEVASYRDAPRPVTPLPAPQPKTFWNRQAERLHKLKLFIVRIFE